MSINQISTYTANTTVTSKNDEFIEQHTKLVESLPKKKVSDLEKTGSDDEQGDSGDDRSEDELLLGRPKTNFEKQNPNALNVLLVGKQQVKAILQVKQDVGTTLQK